VSGTRHKAQGKKNAIGLRLEVGGKTNRMKNADMKIYSPQRRRVRRGINSFSLSGERPESEKQPNLKDGYCVFFKMADLFLFWIPVPSLAGSKNKNNNFISLRPLCLVKNNSDPSVLCGKYAFRPTSFSAAYS
jgi:hypothetical protein